jgi:hypothetical protein
MTSTSFLYDITENKQLAFAYSPIGNGKTPPNKHEQLVSLAEHQNA